MYKDYSNVLNNVKFNFKHANDQENLFTPAHIRYTCTIKYMGKQFTTEYQCNAQDKPTFYKFIYCIMSDADAFEYCRDEADFLTEYGYTDTVESVRTGLKAFKACKRTYKRMHNIFSEVELSTIRHQLESVGY